MPDNKTIVCEKYPDARAKKIGPVPEIGQSASYENGSWEILPSDISELGQQPLGSGATEEAAWADAVTNLSK
ncbi:MAG: hypothetical protein ACKV0T_11770 [Planctomycetales bacterium]